MRILLSRAFLHLTVYPRTMAFDALDSFFAPPASVKGMQSLDVSAFQREVQLPAIRLRDPTLCAKFLQRLKHVILKYPGIKKVLDVDSNGGKVLLLSPTPDPSLSVEDEDWIQANGGERGSHVVSLGYQHYTMHAILRAVLPPDVKEVPSGFETVGHIAHLNLREEVLPYKELIGQVLLSKQPNITTAVNKTDVIDDTFRFFKMELLAGEDKMEATVKESGCTFTFDFSKVYWNSRLHAEHERVVLELERGQTVLDVFAGVGPFALPACKRGCIVHANDLNPHAYSALCRNAEQNYVSKNLKAYNMDGREFITTVTHTLLDDILENLSERSSDTVSVEVYSHVIMNLPASAIEFLDAFKGLFLTVPDHLRHLVSLPMVHCYCFSKSSTPTDDALNMVERELGSALKESTYKIYSVRSVAPNKQMMRVCFQLPYEVAYRNHLEVKHKRIPQKEGVESAQGSAAAEQPPSKRSRLDGQEETESNNEL